MAPGVLVVKPLQGRAYVHCVHSNVRLLLFEVGDLAAGIGCAADCARSFASRALRR